MTRTNETRCVRAFADNWTNAGFSAKKNRADVRTNQLVASVRGRMQLYINNISLCVRPSVRAPVYAYGVGVSPLQSQRATHPATFIRSPLRTANVC